MFQNSYQNGPYFDLFDPKGSYGFRIVSGDKTKNLYKMLNIPTSNKVFDKQLKTYVFEFNNNNSQLVFPRDDKKDLYLIQQYLNFQIFFGPQMWSIELMISDLNKTKRRIILSPVTTKLQIKSFFVKLPITHLIQEGWNQCCINLYSFVNAFKGQTYRSLDSIHICGHFKIKRIFLTNSPTNGLLDHTSSLQFQPINIMPKHLLFPNDVLSKKYVLSYDPNMAAQILETNHKEKASNKTQIRNKAQRNQVRTQKTQKISLSAKKKLQHKNEKSQKIIRDQSKKKNNKFLANTNNTDMLAQRRKIEASESSDIETPKGTEKSLRMNSLKNKLTKTQQIANKVRQSIEQKNERKKQDEKQRTKAKLNPWRTNPKSKSKGQNCTDISNYNVSSDREIGTAKTQTNGKLGGMNKTKKSEQYSESEYFELSQKFSTITQGRLTMNENNLLHNEQIQQRIQMQQTQNVQIQKQIIKESICNSMNTNELRQSYYGFGQNIMKQYMQQIDRSYSPPRIDVENIDEIYQNRNKEQIQLIYDPILKCYYDHKTHTYYQIKDLID